MCAGCAAENKERDGVFPVQAPRLWEEPPQEIRLADSVLSFKALHKTHLYRRDFSDFIPVLLYHAP